MFSGFCLGFLYPNLETLRAETMEMNSVVSFFHLLFDRVKQSASYIVRYRDTVRSRLRFPMAGGKTAYYPKKYVYWKIEGLSSAN